MPLYEYQCKKCGRVFEVLQRVNDEPLSTHEACGGEVERLISPPAFQFKGSGWYITDYAKGSDKHRPSSEKPAGEKPPASEPKSEAPKAASSGTKTPAKA